MKTFFAFTTGLLAGFFGTLVFEAAITLCNGKTNQFMDALIIDE